MDRRRRCRRGPRTRDNSVNEMAVVSINRQGNDKPAPREKIFTVLVLLYSTGAFLPFLQVGRDSHSGSWTGSPVTNALWILAYCICAFSLRRNFSAALSAIRCSWVLVGLLAIAGASVFWSDAPRITLLRWIALLGTTLVALYLRVRYRTHELIGLCAWSIGIAGACSVLAAVLLPEYGVIKSGDFEGAWLGVYGQKNNFGGAMAVGFLLSLLLFRFSKPRRYSYLLFSGFMLALVYLSNSTSSIATCVAMILLFWVTQMVFAQVKGRRRRRLGMAILSAALLLGIIFNFEALTDAAGKDVTLTGRTVIWGLVYQAIQERPLIGYGYEAFWRGDDGPGTEIWNKVGEDLFYSHNGLLEISLAFGLIGLVLFLLSLIWVSRTVIGQLSKSVCLETVWPWLLLCYLILSNLTEASFMRSNTLPWILFSVLLLGLSPIGHGAMDQRTLLSVYSGLPSNLRE